MFTETKYGIEGKELEDINGAIADNALDAARKAMGADHLPKTADDKRKRDMIAKVLNSLQKYENEVHHGSLIAPVQVRQSKAFDEIESKLADALNLVDEQITLPHVTRKPK